MHVSVLAEEDAVRVSRFSVYMLLLHRPSLLGYLSTLRRIQVMSKAEVVVEEFQSVIAFDVGDLLPDGRVRLDP